MKKTVRLISLLIALLMLGTLVLTACDNHTCSSKCPTCGKCLDPDCTEKACKDKCPGGHGSGGGETDVDSYMSVAEYRAYLKNDLDYLRDRIQRGGASLADMAKVNTALAEGKTAIDAAKTISAVRNAFNAAKTAMANCIPLANGTFDFTGFSYSEKTELLGILEEFAIANGMTGTTLYASAGFVMYSERVTLGTENFILGYGFGTLAEGSINSSMPLESESNPAWKLYYHTASATDPGHINSNDDKGSETSDFVSYISSGMYTVFMNAEKNGYDWTPELALGLPQVVGELDENGMAKTWRVEVRQNLKYTTNSPADRTGSFNNRPVAKEDFLTFYKLLLNAQNGWARGSEFANTTQASGIKGAKQYYEATNAAGATTDENGISSADFSGVGLKAYEEDGHTYLEYELLQAVTPFFAMRYCPFGDPVPEEFIGAIGGPSNYLKFGKSGTKAAGWSPVDTSLSTGPYALESWTQNQEIVYKKNPNYVYADSKYQIQGIHFAILPGAKDDPEAIFKEFMAGHLDAAGIPSTQLDAYRNNPLTRRSIGSSCFKLNMNALNAEDWDKFFGENGSVKMTEASAQWKVEPALSNSHFRSALSFALNRNEIGDVFGSIGSVDYFAPHYLANPELGTPYSATSAHKNAVAQLYGTVDGEAQTDDAGYSLELAREYFRMAISEMEAEGLYKPGTKSNPTVINLEIAWQLPVNRKEEHQYVKQYWENAFNDESVTGGLYKLNVEFYVGAQWSDVYYSKMLVGQFDIGFGSISGDSQNPLGDMNILSTNQEISHGFTLNWAIDTNDPSADVLVFKGMRWSYDALFRCTEEEMAVTAGKIADEKADVEYGSDFVKNDDGSLTITINIRTNNGVELEGAAFAIFSSNDYYDDYTEFDLDDTDGIVAAEPVVNGNKTKFVYTVSAEVLAMLPMSGNQGLDIYFWGTKNGEDIMYGPEGYLDTVWHSFTDMVVYSDNASFRSWKYELDENGDVKLDEDGNPKIIPNIAPNGIEFEGGDFGYSVILTTLDGVKDITLYATFQVGYDEIEIGKAFLPATDVDALGGIRFDWKLTPAEIAELIEGLEYDEMQLFIVYADYTDASGHKVTGALVEYYWVEWIEEPAEEEEGELEAQIAKLPDDNYADDAAE